MARDTCYYDGKCGMCRRTVGWLGRLDWLGRLEFRDMTSVPAAELPYPIEQAMQGMPMRTRDGRALIGFQAVRRALLQTPLGTLPALLMYLPGVSAIGARVYRRVATHRGRDEVCRGPQPRRIAVGDPTIPPGGDPMPTRSPVH